MTVITVSVETLCVILALMLATTILSREDIVTGSYSGTFGKFFKERFLSGGRRS